MSDKVLAGRYQLLEQSGMGGMAIVYRAYDMRTGHQVAVKVLRPEFAQDADYVSRFQREAEAASKMTHHNIVNLLDVGMDGENRYLVMEYVQGKTLKQVIQERGRLAPQTAAQITIRILSALQHAHENGIIHRDIKPQNILVNADGHIKVADFGIARMANTSTITHGDIVMGSVQYFSPEQASGQAADARSDIYSVGVVLYEMLTGRIPFDGDNQVAIAMQHIHSRPAPIESLVANVPPAICAVCMKAMSKNPKYRYQTAKDMAMDLRLALEGRGTASIPVVESGGLQNVPVVPPKMAEIAQAPNRNTQPRNTKTHRKLNPTWWIAITVVILMVIVASIWWVYSMIQSSNNIVEVPDFYGMTVDEAEHAAEVRGLKTKIVENNHPTIEAGRVVLQSPSVNTRLGRGDTVALTVSLGPAVLTVPKVIGSTLQDAISLAQSAGLTLTVVDRVVTSDMQAGLIISQVPSEGTICESGEIIQVTLSGGLAIVPELEGMTLPEAQALILDAGLTLSSTMNFIITEDPDKHDIIASQSIAKDTQVIEGTQIMLAVYQMPSMTYSAEVVLDLPESSSLTSVRVTLVHNNTEYTVFQAEYPANTTRHPTATLVAQESGDYLYRVYCNDRFAYQQEVVME